MSDHRRLQRTLFRMQADAGFARAILGRDEAALATTGLDADDLALLGAVDAPSLTADPGGKRRTQIAGNAASEYLLTLALAARERQGKDFLDGFLTSPEFHGAMAEDGRLPLAFGAYALRWAEEHAAPAVAALAALEGAMAALRRRESRWDARAPAPRLSSGDVRLSPRAGVIRVASGTLAGSVALRQALDAGGEIADGTEGTISADAFETILLHVAEAPSPHRLSNVQLELLEPPADELMLLSDRTLSCVERAAFAREHGAEPAALEAFLAPFVAEGVLVTGSD